MRKDILQVLGRARALVHLLEQLADDAERLATEARVAGDINLLPELAVDPVTFDEVALRA